jgi:hypothetical protein
MFNLPAHSIPTLLPCAPGKIKILNGSERNRVRGYGLDLSGSEYTLVSSCEHGSLPLGCMEMVNVHCEHYCSGFFCPKLYGIILCNGKEYHIFIAFSVFGK